MKQIRLDRRSFTRGGTALALGLLAAHPGARYVRAQNGAAYDLIDLGAFEESISTESGLSITGLSRINAINESGDICGRFAVSAERFSPAVWPVTGELRRLKSATLGGEARAINADGVVVGRQQYEVDGGYITRATVWRNGEPTNLPGLLFGDEGSARDINDDGVIVGGVGTPVIGARWIDDEPEELPTPDGSAGFAPWRINNEGTIFGVVVVESPDAPRRVAFLQGEEYSGIELPEEVQGYLAVNGATAIGMSENEIGVVTVGFESTVYPIRIEGEEVVIIDPPAADVNLALWDVNLDGDAVGYVWSRTDGFETVNAVAIVHRAGELIDLNTLVSVNDLRLTEALAINDAGVIAGHARDASGVLHGVILSPTS
jgi:uncharacterized membrane protein